MVIIYTTCSDVKSAKRIGAALLTARLAACYNFWTLQSSYWWQGKIVNEREVALLIKTTSKQTMKVKQLLKKIHPYKVPCIAVLPAKQLNAEYKKWLANECR